MNPPQDTDFFNLEVLADAAADDFDRTEESEPQLSSSETHMIGYILVKIVGLQHYSAQISAHELVCLVREPLNPRDKSAIKVLNTCGVQVGHIDRLAAKVLAPLIDSNLIFVEGIIPKTSKNFKHQIPCQIHVFARHVIFPIVKSAITDGGLQLVLHESPSFSLSKPNSVRIKERSSTTRKRKGIKCVDDIFKTMERTGSSVSPLEPPKDVIVSDLYDHQKYALGWLVGMENSVELPPFWEEKGRLYFNILTKCLSSIRPKPLNGGIFADDMGLGKTLTLLSLIAYDKVLYGNRDKMEEEDEEDEEEGGVDIVHISWGKKCKRGRKGKILTTSTSMNKSNGDGYERCLHLHESKATLVVCPCSVFSTWVTQLSEHTKPDSLTMYKYYGLGRTKDVKELKKYDIVLTTYNILSCEFHEIGTPLPKIMWWRIILDEGHVIKNHYARQTRSVIELNSRKRWIVSGTPIQNSPSDLFALLAFLKFDPFCNRSYWNSLISRPLGQNEGQGLERLRVLMATVSLRRTKDQNLICLPSKTVQICHVDLFAEERELYDQMEVEGQKFVNTFIYDHSVTRNYSAILSILLRLRQICADVSLCPHDIKSLFDFETTGECADVSNNPELLEKMLVVLEDGEDFDCPICISPPTDVVITRCAHLFCRGCIIKTLKRTNPNCPMCRHPLSESDLFSAPPPPDSSSDINSGASSSSKVTALLKLLSESKNEKEEEEEEAIKSVVFSQFRKMLLLLEGPLKNAGYKTLRLDGTMSATKRAKVIEEFSVPGPNSPTVLLASLKACGTGINLTAATVVYLFEPWWNPAAEEQAMDRVHRIGQKRDVRIVRIIARNTIEERVLQLQEKKRELARGAFQKTDTKNNRLNLEDLRTLMSL